MDCYDKLSLGVCMYIMFECQEELRMLITTLMKGYFVRFVFNHYWSTNLYVKINHVHVWQICSNVFRLFTRGSYWFTLYVIYKETNPCSDSVKRIWCELHWRCILLSWRGDAHSCNIRLTSIMIPTIFIIIITYKVHAFS